MKQIRFQVITSILVLCSLLMGCAEPLYSPGMEELAVSGTPTVLSSIPSLTPNIPTTTSTHVNPASSPTLTLVPSLTPVPEPPECKRPPDDYALVRVNGYLFNQRTVSMLEYAAEIYGGEIDILGYSITQGSFSDNGSASFGTHLGGGAVDLSVMRFQTYTVLEDEIPPLLNALRLAGFAAWLREKDEIYPGSGIHIHAIAIGDEQLSDSAKAQLTGPAGYFRGLSGLPPAEGKEPTADRFGGPVLCNWMIEMGYTDLRD